MTQRPIHAVSSTSAIPPTPARLNLALGLLALVLACAMVRPPESPATVSGELRARSVASAPTVPPGAALGISRLPLHFEVNRGQAVSRVDFVSSGASHRLMLTAGQAVLVMPRGPGHPGETAAVTLGLGGANARARAEGVDELPGKVNYFIGNDPTAWRTNIPTYAAVRYRDVYPGVDVVYHGRQGQLEFDFVVAPHADPSRIRLSLAGPGALRLDGGGELVIGEGSARLRLRKPVVYQEIGGERREIVGRYVRTGRGGVRFALARYDHRVALVIDPILVATYIGGNGNEFTAGVAIDGSGNVIVSGNTTSGNYPLANPATNQLTGTPNTPANIPPGIAQTFLVAITGNAAFAAADIPFSFGCANRPSAIVISGVNTLLMSTSDAPTADIVALGATPSNDGIINIPGPGGTGIFGVATSNVGVTADITVTADSGGVALPVNLFVCQTNPNDGTCKEPPALSVQTTIAAGATPTFALFAQGTGNVSFNPGQNRAFVRFKQGNQPVGATSAALRTQ